MGHWRQGRCPGRPASPFPCAPRKQRARRRDPLRLRQRMGSVMVPPPELACLSSSMGARPPSLPLVRLAE
eukprot:6252011-Lingulodinium_polyedra.AAC.1